MTYREPIYVVDGARTPFLKSKNRPGPFAAGDLAAQAGRALLMRQPFAPDELDEVILGCAAPSVDEVNIGRVAALRMGRSEEHTSELQSQSNLVCRLLLEKKKKQKTKLISRQTLSNSC